MIKPAANPENGKILTKFAIRLANSKHFYV